jgi:integrase
MTSDKQFNFTVQSILALTSPDKGIVVYKDTKEKGLSLYITANGIKTFFVRKRVKGRDERILIGQFPDIKIEQARKRAAALKGLVASNIDPKAEERKEKLNRKTFGDLFHEYMERYSKVHKKSWRYDEREVKKFLSHWLKRQLLDISKIDVQRLHEKIHAENGLYQANRMLERVRAMYNKGIEWGWEGVNPAIGIKKYKEKSRDRFIQPHEMPCLLKSLEEETNQTAKDYFLILLLTGVRRTNTLTMRWTNIDWDSKEWRIPDTKNGEPLTVPLLDKAIEILKERKKSSNSDWVFPSDFDNEKHLVNFKRPWKRTLQKATIYSWLRDEKFSKLIDHKKLEISGYEAVDEFYEEILFKAKRQKIELTKGLMDIHIHDIRRTFGSYQAITGASLQVIGKSLGHKSPQSTLVYARLNLDPVRASIEKASNAMFNSYEK